MTSDDRDGRLPRPLTVLAVDDEDTFHDGVARHLKQFRVIKAHNGLKATEALEKHHVDVILLDLHLPDVSGMELLDQFRREHSDVEIIVVTSHSELSNAVAAVKKGAFDFVPKTLESYKRLPEHIARAIEHRGRRREQLALQGRQAWLLGAFKTIEESGAASMREAVRSARKYAKTPLTILLEGESGVGKEVMARYLHAHSDRADKNFVAINPGAVPESLLESHLFGHVKGAFTGADKTQLGKFELADGGTLFIDEVGELDAGAQIKFLRVLQEREIERLGAAETSPIDLRVIAATNKTLAHEVKEGRFRQDLFYRLNCVQIRLPALRQRAKTDLPALLMFLCEKHAAKMRVVAPTFAQEAVDALTAYEWPGNIRELENLIMCLVASRPGREIVLDDIPVDFYLSQLNEKALKSGLRKAEDSEKGLLYLAREQCERYLIRLMVTRCNGDRRAAAERLGISYSQINKKMKLDDE